MRRSSWRRSAPSPAEPLVRRTTAADGTGLACLVAGTGEPVMLIHGLLGRGAEWRATLDALSGESMLVAPDLRGHGDSDRHPRDRSPGAFVADLLRWRSTLGIDAMAVVGQSFGGRLAIELAASRPEAVTRLIVVEASPAPDPGAAGRVAAWLDTWPARFSGIGEALEVFGDTPWGRAWAASLRETGDGLTGAFDREVALDALGQLEVMDGWEAWRSISCPALVVRGEHGMPSAAAHRMARELPGTRVATVAGASHDVHLERPAEWVQLLRDFLSR